MRIVRIFILSILNRLPKKWKWKLFSWSIFNRKLRIDFLVTRKKLFAKPSNIIIVGANDGLSFDDLFQSLDPNLVSGIVIEPSKKYFSILQENLKAFEKIQFLNLAITNSEEYFSLYQLNDQGLKKLPDWGKGLGSLSKENLLKFDEITEGDIEEEIVRGITFDRIINDQSLFNVDYLQIDTEGFDGKIIGMIDFDSFKPQLLKFEWVNLSPTEINDCKEKLIQYDFYVSELGGDMVGYSRNINPIFS